MDAALAENKALKEKLATLEMEMQTLRFFTGKPDLDDMATRIEGNAAIVSPDVGTRVRVVHSGSKYNAKDFEKAGSFDAYKGEYADAVANDQLGLILQKAKHFKKESLEVFLIKFDNNKAAIMARKGFDVPLFLGCGVQIVNQGCKYAAKDFKEKDGYSDLNDIVDEVKQGSRGVLMRILPHYKAKVTCFVVALNDTGRCVVMAGKGVAPADVRGLKERLAKRKEEREAAAKEEEEKKRKAEASPEGEPDAKKEAAEES